MEIKDRRQERNVFCFLTLRNTKRSTRTIYINLLHTENYSLYKLSVYTVSLVS